MSTLNVGTIQSNSATTPPIINNSSGTEIGTFCRAWVNFDGSTTVTIRTSLNVNSITDNAAGDYTMNFSVALADVNFCVMGLGFETAVNRACIMMGDATNNLTLTTSSVRFRAFRGGSSTTIDDPARMCVVVFR